MITLAEAKAALGVTDTSQDAAIQRMIDRATATLGRELLRYLGPELEQVEIKDVSYPGTFISLDEAPTATPALTMETRTDAFDAWTLEDPADYVLEGRRVYHRTSWPLGVGVVRATYEAGYAAGTGPQHFQDLILQMVTDRWNANAAAVTVGGGLKRERIGDYEYENFTASDLEAAASALGTNWKDYVRRWKRTLI